MRHIDINCDLGEGIANEHLLMPYISSCNIACGGHFGDEHTIRKTIALALENNVKIGAHPSFPDTENFGRKILKITPNELQKSIQFQMDLISSQLQEKKTQMHHIKAHGALYNLIAKDHSAASHFITSIEKYVQDSCLYVPYNSEIEKVAVSKNIRIKYEAFADRNYNNDLSLVARKKSNAIISEPYGVYKHLYNMIVNNSVLTITGEQIQMKADTFCIHGDNANALEILKELTKLLKAQKIQIV